MIVNRNCLSKHQHLVVVRLTTHFSFYPLLSCQQSIRWHFWCRLHENLKFWPRCPILCGQISWKLFTSTNSPLNPFIVPHYAFCFRFWLDSRKLFYCGLLYWYRDAEVNKVNGCAGFDLRGLFSVIVVKMTILEFAGFCKRLEDIYGGRVCWCPQFCFRCRMEAVNWRRETALHRRGEKIKGDAHEGAPRLQIQATA